MKVRNLIVQSVLGVTFLMGAQAAFASLPTGMYGGVQLINQTAFNALLVGAPSSDVVSPDSTQPQPVPNICRKQLVQVKGITLTSTSDGATPFAFDPCLGANMTYTAFLQLPHRVHTMQITSAYLSRPDGTHINYTVTITDLTLTPSSNATNRQVSGSGASTLGPATNRNSDNPSW